MIRIGLLELKKCTAAKHTCRQTQTEYKHLFPGQKTPTFKAEVRWDLISFKRFLNSPTSEKHLPTRIGDRLLLSSRLYHPILGKHIWKTFLRALPGNERVKPLLAKKQIQAPNSTKMPGCVGLSYHLGASEV